MTTIESEVSGVCVGAVSGVDSSSVPYIPKNYYGTVTNARFDRNGVLTELTIYSEGKARKYHLTDSEGAER